MLEFGRPIFAIQKKSCTDLGRLFQVDLLCQISGKYGIMLYEKFEIVFVIVWLVLCNLRISVPFLFFHKLFVI